MCQLATASRPDQPLSAFSMPAALYKHALSLLLNAAARHHITTCCMQAGKQRQRQWQERQEDADLDSDSEASGSDEDSLPSIQSGEEDSDSEAGSSSDTSEQEPLLAEGVLLVSARLCSYARASRMPRGICQHNLFLG